jgi:hypothetical protein
MTRAFAIVVAVLAGGCTHPTGPRTVANRDLGVKIPAMKTAAKAKDPTAAAQLVAELESDDPAIRFFAIGALKRLTKDDLGYRYYLDPEARQPAVQRWRKWMEQADH